MPMEAVRALDSGRTNPDGVCILMRRRQLIAKCIPPVTTVGARNQNSRTAQMLPLIGKASARSADSSRITLHYFAVCTEGGS